MLLPLLGRPGKLRELRHFKAYFFFDNFPQGDVGRPELAGLDQLAAHAAAAGVELPDTAGNKVDENVGVTNLLQGFSCEFGVQSFFSVLEWAK